MKQITCMKNNVRGTSKKHFRCVASWLATCAWKPKVSGSSPAAGYVQVWAFCSNRLANVKCL